jgi:glycosyltransferase involved in cell wall biosynthesis
MARIAVVVTTEATVHAFLRRHLEALSARHEVTLYVHQGPELATRLALPSVGLVHVPFSRKPDPRNDLACLALLTRSFAARRPDLVYSVSPKAGLLAMVAARLARVPSRVHAFTGQVWATRRGPGRMVLKSIDTCIARCCSAVLADSRSQLAFLRREGVVAPGVGTVLGQGSVSGVDAGVFRPDPDERAVVRAELGVPEGTVLLLFLGRLNRDKGVLDLVRALAHLRGLDLPPFALVLVGPDEAGIRADPLVVEETAKGAVRHVGFTPRPMRYLAAADLFCLPSYREGFGSSIIEAAAVGIPAVASDIYGIQDAIENGVTGILHAPGDPPGIARAIAELLLDPRRREDMGRAARLRAVRDFAAVDSTRLLVGFLEAHLRQRRLDPEEPCSVSPQC